VNETVLDATAVLALLNDERGADRVASLLQTAVISTVNLAEVVSKLAEAGMPEPIIRTVINELGLKTVPFDETLAFLAGLLRPATNEYGLSLGDRACLALGQHLRKPVLTADRMWRSLKLDVAVRLIR
jgi:PIN domain nuclease of toxin-antitoxin system